MGFSKGSSRVAQEPGLCEARAGCACGPPVKAARENDAQSIRGFLSRAFLLFALSCAFVSCVHRCRFIVCLSSLAHVYLSSLLLSSFLSVWSCAALGNSMFRCSAELGPLASGRACMLKTRAGFLLLRAVVDSTLRLAHCSTCTPTNKSPCLALPLGFHLLAFLPILGWPHLPQKSHRFHRSMKCRQVPDLLF